MSEGPPINIPTENEDIPSVPSFVTPGFKPEYKYGGYKTEEFENAARLFTSDQETDQLKGAGILLGKLAERNHQVEEQIHLLDQHIASLISFALEHPQLHRQLVDIIDGYYERASGQQAFDKKAILREVLLQLNISHGEANEAKAAFGKMFVSYYRASYIPKDNKGIRPITADMRGIFYDTDFENFYTERDIDGKAISRAMGETTKRAFLDDSIVDGDFEKREALTMLKVLSLEQEHPGICHRLQSQYGISAFFRYPPGLLIELDKTGKDTTIKKRVLVINAIGDNNGGIADENYYKHLLNLKKHGIEPLILEIDSVAKLEELVASLDPNIRSTIFQGVINGHGDPYGMALSSGQELTHTHLDQLAKIFTNLRELKHLIISGCSTGADTKDDKNPEIARAIRDVLRRVKVEAPPGDRGNYMRATRHGVKYRPFYYLLLLPTRKKVYEPLE